jgi:phage tail sheath protein FI
MYSNGNAVNPIVNFIKDGVVIFGQRTLQRSASALDRINVRRMLNYIKRTSVVAVRQFLFEPNDQILWGQLANILKPIYQDVKNKRGINRFEVVFDDKTTPAIARDNNEVYGYIIIEPTKAAEKIILSFVITAQGASFSEALAAAGVA